MTFNPKPFSPLEVAVAGAAVFMVFSRDEWPWSPVITHVLIVALSLTAIAMFLRANWKTK